MIMMAYPSGYATYHNSVRHKQIKEKSIIMKTEYEN